MSRPFSFVRSEVVSQTNAGTIGRLYTAYVESGGDTTFMTMPDVETQNGEILVPELPEVGTAGSIDYTQMTPAQLEQEVGSSIRINANTNAKGVDIAVIDSMIALLDVETRVKKQSGNANHPGIGIDAIHDTYMGYLRGEMALDTTAWSMVEAIKTVVNTQTLTEAETGKLMSTLTEIVGDAQLAEAYVARTATKPVGYGGNKVVNVLESKTETNADLTTKVNHLKQFADDNKVYDLRLSIEDILKTSGGKIDLAEKLILATKEVIPGKAIPELVLILNILESPELRSLSTYKARVWYLYQESLIKDKLDYSKPLEQVAYDAFNMRNEARTKARDVMMDRAWADYLMKNEKNKTFEQLVEYYSEKYSGDALWKKIIQSATKSRDSVNKLFGL